MDEFQVWDDERCIEFAGELLAYVSSAAPGKDRWLELTVYRTAAGAFVLAGVGRSNRPGEVDRKWAQISLEPEGVIDRLTMFDEDTGAEYIPNTSRKLLSLASDKDARIKRAYTRTRIA